MTELPRGWAWAPLGDLGRWEGGGTPSKSTSDYWTGDIPWVSPKDMKVERIVDTADHITSAAVKASATRIVPAGSVLVVTRSGILRHSLPVALADREVALNQDMKALTPMAGIQPEYVAWAIRADANKILATCSKSGTTVSNIETSRLLEYEIPIPPLAEQRRIVGAVEESVSRLDVATLGLAAARRKAGAWLDAVLTEALHEPAAPSMRLADLCPVFVDCPHRTPRYCGTGIPALRPRDVVGGVLDMENAARVDRAEFSRQTERRVPQPGDIIYSRELSYGWAVVVPEGIGLCLSQGMVLFRPDERMSSALLVLVLNSRLGRAQAEAAATGSAHPHINLRDIHAYSIPVPPRPVQEAVLATVEQAATAVSRVSASLAETARHANGLRRAILACAYRGELVPQDPDDEPASVLLDRIAAERAASAPARLRRRRAQAGR
ncbi:MAG: restriction endonuclease subunit S [Gaiellaceae bacterium]